MQEQIHELNKRQSEHLRKKRMTISPGAEESKNIFQQLHDKHQKQHNNLSEIDGSLRMSQISASRESDYQTEDPSDKKNKKLALRREKSIKTRSPNQVSPSNNFKFIILQDNDPAKTIGSGNNWWNVESREQKLYNYALQMGTTNLLSSLHNGVD